MPCSSESPTILAAMAAARSWIVRCASLALGMAGSTPPGAPSSSDDP